MCSPYRMWILQSHGKALCPPGTTQGSFTSPYLHGFSLPMTIFSYIHTSDRRVFCTVFWLLNSALLAEYFQACKRLLCCSVKSCSHRAESHLWQRACTRPCTAQEHKGSYTCPPCSSRSAEAPGAFSRRLAWVQAVLSAPHCCCRGTGEKGLAHHRERSEKLLIQPHSGANTGIVPTPLETWAGIWHPC